MHRSPPIVLLALLTLVGCAQTVPPMLPTLAALPTDPAPTHTTPTLPPTVTDSPSPEPARSTPTATRTSTATPSPTITQIPPTTLAPLPTETLTPLDVTFVGIYPLEPYLRQPILAALEADRAALPPISAWTLSAFRAQGDWMKVVLVPTELVEAGWQGIEQYAGQWAEVVIQRVQTGEYRAGVLGGKADWLRGVPPEFINLDMHLPPMAGAYLFPWEAGQVWWAIEGWHDGNALDFQPAYRQRHIVLAAEAGRLREICYDGTQSWVEIQHADGEATYYLHLTLGRSVRADRLDQNVVRGQPLGALISRAPFFSPCGLGYSRHLHFSVTNRALVVDGYALETLAASARCCSGSPEYSSTNQRTEQPAP
ncbi:MAG TPA: M23 family metallopeptidase [Aggregatilineales bacterium]|nr:M23 family metallopeptidase [Aggregatilineales bacterium]